MTTKQPLSPYLLKPLRSLEEVLRERHLTGRKAGVSPGRKAVLGGRAVDNMPAADNSNDRQAAPLRFGSG